VNFFINHEARDEALKLYQPCIGATFRSPHPYPYNLWSPDRDTLFIPISLYSLQASEARNTFSATAALSTGAPREFILDRLTSSPDPNTDTDSPSPRTATPPPTHPSSITQIHSLAITWADLPIRETSIPTLLASLAPFENLHELSLVFFDVRPENLNQDIRILPSQRGRYAARLIDPEEGVVRGRYLERMLEEFEDFCGMVSEGFGEVERGWVREGGTKRLPKVSVKIVRFEV
jgi:hypothetical protein